MTFETLLCSHPGDQISPHYLEIIIDPIICLLFPLSLVLKILLLNARNTTHGCEATTLTRTFLSLLLARPSLYNAKDQYAVAIVEDTGRMVGHIPWGLSKNLPTFLNRPSHKPLEEICEKLSTEELG